MKSILTPRQLAEAIGVSESSVKRWVDDGHIAATRTAGGHRRIETHEAVRYIREHGSTVVRPDLLGLPGRGASESAGEVGFGGAADRLFDYLRAGAAAEAHGLLVSSYLEGRSVAEIMDGPLASAMDRIGELWVTSPSGILWEHRATEIAIQAVVRLRVLLQSPDPVAAAVGGAPTGDCYILPSLAAAAVLEAEGLRVTNLGPETPLATLARGVEDPAVRVAWLSVSVAAEVDKLCRGIHDLAARLAERGGVLVVGGSAAGQLALSRSDALYVGRSMGELEALVRGLRLGSKPVPVPA